MPEVGGKQLATDLRMALPDLRKVAGALRERAKVAVTQFSEEARNVEHAIKSIEDETAEMRQIANEMLGNNPPEITANGKGN